MGRDAARKDRIIGELEYGFGGRTFLVLEHEGVPSGAFSVLRRAIEPEAVLRVTKGTLGRIAAARAGLPPEVTAMIHGPVAVAFIGGDIAVASRELLAFRDHGLSVRGGLENGRVLSRDDVAVIASQGSRQRALAQAAGALSAPLRTLAALLRARERSM